MEEERKERKKQRKGKEKKGGREGRGRKRAEGIIITHNSFLKKPFLNNNGMLQTVHLSHTSAIYFLSIKTFKTFTIADNHNTALSSLNHTQ